MHDLALTARLNIASFTLLNDTYIENKSPANAVTFIIQEYFTNSEPRYLYVNQSAPINMITNSTTLEISEYLTTFIDWNFTASIPSILLRMATYGRSNVLTGE